jgi:hypothetical protein
MLGGHMRPEMALAHYQTIAEATDLPLILFQYPMSTGMGYPFDTMMKLVEKVPTIRAMKDWCHDPLLHEKHTRTLQGLPRPVNMLTTHSSWLMSSLVMGARSATALARAAELGVAMQLTNIARDVGEDARNGRLYLPRAWLREEGVNVEAWLQQPVFTPAIARCTHRLLMTADALYARAEHGLQELPMDCRPAIQAARVVYAEIGRQLERQGLDAIRQRAVVSSRRKLTLIALATGTAFIAPAQPLGDPAPLPAVRFLVDAVRAGEATSVSHSARPPRRSFDERMAWATDLHARLVERDDGAREAQVARRG